MLLVVVPVIVAVGLIVDCRSELSASPGPNRAEDQIITRWKINKNGSRVERQGKPVLEFVAIRRADDHKWALPGGFVRQNGVLPIMRKAFGLEESTTADDEELREVEEMLKTRGETVFSGFMDDPRNTDNAWVETTAVNVHDDRQILAKFQLLDHTSRDILDVTWAVAHKNLDLFVDHQALLQRVVERKNAFW
eukprot:m.19842 g.19842  ORF g.19842 m.19842 type:complete len:193 (+) comp3780_c0_seq2:57-635(+)